MRWSMVLLVLGLIFYIYLRSCSWMGVDEITVSGNKKITQEEILALSGIKPGANILAVNYDAAKTAVKVHPFIRAVAIEWRFPKNLEIVVHERTIWAVVPFKQEFLCIDRFGYCMDKEARINLNDYVLITFDKLPDYATLGQPFMASAMETVYHIWDGLNNQERQNISEYHYVTIDNSVVMYTVNGTEIRFGDNNRLAEKMELLKKAMALEQNYIDNNGDMIEYIDLRFKGQPVIKTKS